MINFDDLFDLKKSPQLYKVQAPELIEYLKAKQGWIYVSHSAINEVGGVATKLKIGRTGKSAMQRAKSLSSTGVAEPYHVLFSLQFLNQFIAENMIKKKLNKYRGTKEFYYVNLDMAVDCIQEEYTRQKQALSRYMEYENVKDDLDVLEHYLKV